MADNASRRGAVDLGMVLMVLAFAVFAGSMFWLNGQAAIELADNAAVEEPVDDSGPGSNAARGTAVVAMDLQPDASSFEGQTVTVEATAVASLLGQQGFWLEFPQSPFLVSLSDELISGGASVQPGQTVEVTGTVTLMSEEIAASWVEAERISEGDQLAASFASHFIAADAVEVVAGGEGN